jgi:non-canonical purine NTP pyrophosphatase (RdgB/HAM1 family)
MSVTFITGNDHKAKLLEKYLGVAVERVNIDLDELQSLDLHEITEHKVRQAYERVQKPVLVEDVSLKFAALGNLPGPLIKWFLEELRVEGILVLLKHYEDRGATAQVTYAYFDGQNLQFFDGVIYDTISEKPRGEDFGWNPIFIPNGSGKTYAEMNDEDLMEFGLRNNTVFPEIKKFLLNLDKA